MMPALPVGTTLGPYPFRIEHPLGTGRGNMAEVYLATAHGPGAHRDYVAIKIARITNEYGDFYEEGLRNEVQLLPRLKHPSIVRILPISPPGAVDTCYSARASVAGEPLFAVLEYLDGGTLAELLARYPQGLSVSMALAIGHALAVALHYIHLAGIVHMDVKPDNIVFRYPVRQKTRVEPVFVDFGIARRVGQEPLGGTIPYMAPERTSGYESAQPGMDVFALGLVLYSMLTGRLPYEEQDDERLRQEIRAGNYRPPSRLRAFVAPAALAAKVDAIVMKAMDPEPDKRCTAHELAEALENVAREVEAAPARTKAKKPAEVTLPIGWRPLRQVWRALAAAALVMLAAVTLAFAVTGGVPADIVRVPGTMQLVPQAPRNSSAAGSGATATTKASPTATPVPAKTTANTPSPKATTAARRASTPTTRTTAAATAATKPAAAVTATATSTPTATPTVTITPTEQIPAMWTVTNVELLWPPDNAVITSPVTFSWQPNGNLPPNYGYVPAVWFPDEDYSKEEFARSLVDPTTDTWVTVDLKKLVEEGRLPNVERNENVKWGIFLVDLGTGKLKKYLGDEHWIRVE